MLELKSLKEIVVLKFEGVWNQIYQLSDIILEKFQPDILIGISRGGLVVTRFLSDLMNINNVAVLGVGFYTGINETAKKPIITQELSVDIKNKKVLLVDDVADTGVSLEFAIEYLQKQSPKELKIATIHYKPQSIIKPDFYIKETSKWIVYPWEYQEFSHLFYEKMKKQNYSRKEILDQLLLLGLPKIITELIEKKFKEK
ncbi:MAG: phosphoribosyltransferase [Asgard group archaeon]|nr:phosphoribosyltransferase [Asgard group archaeon]